MSFTWLLAIITYPSWTTATTSICSHAASPHTHTIDLLAGAESRLQCHGQTSEYIIRSSPGKGLGVYALRDLEVGTVIMREMPVLKIRPPDHVKGSGYPMEAVARLLRADFVHLSVEAQEEVMSLSYYGTPAQLNSSDPLALIFKTNAYKSGEEIGLFPRIARINHSCRPNTSYFWHARSNTRVMYANRKIGKGEEILDSYVSLLQPREERQKHLNAYGFTCGCEVCAANGKIRQKSDQRRKAIKKGFTDLSPYLGLDDPDLQMNKKQAGKNAQLSKAVAEMVHEEGLADYYATAYRIAAISHARAGDWQAATIWANKGYEWRVMEDPESSYAMEMHELTARFIEKWKDDLKSKKMLSENV